MSDDMVDRVAQAIAGVENHNCDYWIDFSPGEQLAFFQMARAAISAMLAPTNAMIDAAAETPGMSAASSAMLLHQARGYGFDADAFKNGSPLHQAWRAMLGVALASCDTHPKDGDVEQTPLVSGAIGSEASETPNPEHGSSPSIEVPE